MCENGLSPCCTWSHTPPACGWATVTQTPCWVAPEKTPSLWGCLGVCRLQSPAGSAGASTRAAVEAWTPAPAGHIPPSADCTTTAGHDVMNKKHDCVCLVSDTNPATEGREGEGEREKVKPKDFLWKKQYFLKWFRQLIIMFYMQLWRHKLTIKVIHDLNNNLKKKKSN